MTTGIIQHSKPTLGEEELRAVTDVMRSGHIAQGEKVKEFEEALAHLVGVKGAVAVNSGTSALHLGLLAMGSGPGDEVILPSYVCTAPLNAVYMAGATPRLSDIEPESSNISAEAIEEVRTKKTKAVVVPHMFGSPADLEKIEELGMAVIEDCAHSIGALYGDKRVGSIGKFAMMSFYANKMLAAGEGGAIVSDDDDILNFARDRRDYDEREEYRLRYNYKMTDMQAAVGLVQIGKLEDMIKVRKEKALVYDRILRDTGVKLPAGEFDHVYYRYVIGIKKDPSTVISLMEEEGIKCARPVYKPLHRYLELRSGFRYTDEVYSHALSIPIYPSLTKEEQERVIKALISSL